MKDPIGCKHLVNERVGRYNIIPYYLIGAISVLLSSASILMYALVRDMMTGSLPTNPVDIIKMVILFSVPIIFVCLAFRAAQVVYRFRRCELWKILICPAWIGLYRPYSKPLQIGRDEIPLRIISVTYSPVGRYNGELFDRVLVCILLSEGRSFNLECSLTKLNSAISIFKRYGINTIECSMPAPK